MKLLAAGGAVAYCWAVLYFTLIRPLRRRLRRQPVYEIRGGKAYRPR